MRRLWAGLLCVGDRCRQPNPRCGCECRSSWVCSGWLTNLLAQLRPLTDDFVNGFAFERFVREQVIHDGSNGGPVVIL